MGAEPRPVKRWVNGISKDRRKTILQISAPEGTQHNPKSPQLLLNIRITLQQQA